MPKVADITVLNIDEKPYAVDSLSEEVQGLVDIYNDWNQKEAEVRDELTRFQAAKETLSRQIISKVREDLVAAEAAANDAEATAEAESTEASDASDASKAAETAVA